MSFQFTLGLTKPRPIGARNHDFEIKRAERIDEMTEYGLEADLRRPSLRQFPIAAKASEPTLRHYLDDRQGGIKAIHKNMGRRGVRIWEMVSHPANNPTKAIGKNYRVADASMRYGNFSRAHAFGLMRGIADEDEGGGLSEIPCGTWPKIDHG